MAARTLAATPEDWELVAEAVHARRIELDLTAKEVIDRAGRGLSIGVLSLIENNRRTSYSVRTMKAVCRALGWTSDSVELLLAGDQPQESAEGSEARTLVERVADLEREVAEIRAQLEQRRDPDGSAGRSA